jgi:eukaryotic-like serine/threonine-protein kinase
VAELVCSFKQATGVKMAENEDFPKGSLAGRRVGVYRLDEEVGRGGMGVIYRASRADGEFDQTVAVKLIKRGMDTDAILQRFRRERQITAALNHPNIAYFYGGGSTEDGLPYFVMEFIKGLPIYAHCDRFRLTVRERLAIFRQVCWAVQAAHENKVIHRDLKPSNIMVNSEGKPKLLDFGIAKILDPQPGITDHIPTGTQMRMMTPEYASPEQISGGDLSPASDIYSLGVILYELLTGHRPYSLHRNAVDDVARIIREEYPTSPSGSLTRLDDLVPVDGDSATVEKVIASRNSSLENLRQELSGDLDRIILKAMRKDPAERYTSSAEFAEDISNFLEHRPVKAEFFVSLAKIPRPKATDRLSIAILPFRSLGSSPESTNEFLGIGLADALISRLSGVQRLVVRPTTSVLSFSGALPHAAAKQLDVDFVLDGTVRVIGERIRLSVQLYSARDDSTRWAHAFDESVRDVLELEDSLAEQMAAVVLPQLTAEERIRLERRGTNKPAAYEAYLRGRFFWSRFSDSALTKMVEAFKEAIAIDPEYALPYIGLADFYIWSAIFGELPSDEAFPRAEAAARKALEIDESVGEAYAVLAFCLLLSSWNWEDAEELVLRAMELAPNYAFAHECYSNFLCSQGRFEEAIVEIRRAEELDPMSPRSSLMTSWILYQSRRYNEAVASAIKGNNMQPDFPQGLLHLGNSLTSAGRHDEAVSVLRKSAEKWGESGLPRYMLAHARAAQGSFDAVNIILSKMLGTAERRHMKAYFVAMCYVAARDHDKAFEWFQKAVDEKNEWMIWFGVEPKLDPLRSDPRYHELLAKTNNPLTFTDQGTTAQERRSRETRQRSIAVLPFKLIRAPDSETGEYDYLSLGLADALTMRLSNVRRFVVRPTSSVLPFERSDIDPFAAGRELNVEFVVDGIVRYVSGKIRMTAQLLNVQENSLVWSASFSQEFCDVLELEDSLSEQVSGQLLPQITGDEKVRIAKRGTDNLRAYEAYLQGRYFWSRFEPESFPKSIAAFMKAVELDPTFALAHVGIADFYAWASIYGLVAPTIALPQMLASAREALHIDASLAEAHAALGLYHSNMQEWETAKKCYRNSIELNPNYALAHEWLSSILVAGGEIEEGLDELRMAETLDPMSLRPKVLSAWTYYQARDYATGLVKAEELLTLDPSFMQSHLQTANILLELKEFDRALRESTLAVQIEPNSPLPEYVHTFALAANNRPNEAIDRIRMWEERARENYVPPYFIGMSWLAVGEIDTAFEYFDKTRTEYSAWTIWFGTEPKLDIIRNDPRYKALIAKMNGPVRI